MAARRRGLELLIPPPLVALVTAGLIWLGAWAWPAATLLPLPLAWVMIPVALAGVLGTMGLFHFFRARTTIHPHFPERTRALVCYGVYRLSRNPMYLALLLLLLAWALWIGHLLAPLWLAGFVAYITRFQILPEERVLRVLFGEEYKRYQARTRRWL